MRERVLAKEAPCSIVICGRKGEGHPESLVGKVQGGKLAGNAHRNTLKAW